MSTETLEAPRANTDRLTGGVIAYLHLPDAAAAADFYVRAFGAKERSRTTSPDGSGKIMNCQLEINGGTLMLMDLMPPSEASKVTLQLIVPDGKAWLDRAIAAGAKVGVPFQKMFWGDLWGSVVDPFGLTWGVNQPSA